MLKINETIIVEGTYDKIKLSSFIDGHIIATNGFSIFHNPEKIAYIKQMAEKNGILILTDSDRAGFLIRNYIKKFVPEERIKNAFIPEIAGVEKRKKMPGRQKLLGVEGVPVEAIKKAILDAGIDFGEDGISADKSSFTRADLYRLGYLGGENASAHRSALCRLMRLPLRISVSELLKVINRVFTQEEFLELAEKIKNEENC